MKPHLMEEVAMLEFFYNLFKKPKSRQKDLEKFMNNIVTYYSHGNVNLQMGNFITNNKAKMLKQRILMPD